MEAKKNESNSLKEMKKENGEELVTSEKIFPKFEEEKEVKIPETPELYLISNEYGKNLLEGAQARPNTEKKQVTRALEKSSTVTDGEAG